jgi:hypothetical protein
LLAFDLASDETYEGNENFYHINVDALCPAVKCHLCERIRKEHIREPEGVGVCFGMGGSGIIGRVAFEYNR